MITYSSLACENHHEFDAWFRSAEAFDEQAGRRIVSCPVCGSVKVEKALMAPGRVPRQFGQGVAGAAPSGAGGSA